VIKAPHPSPLSVYRGFFGQKPFSRANEYLLSNRKSPIQWELPVRSIAIEQFQQAQQTNLKICQ